MNYLPGMLVVTCAVIYNSRNEVLAVQRSESMRMPLKWEFPGGKVELGETEKEALIREIREELRMTIFPEKRMQPVNHRYETGTICLVPYLARIGDVSPQLTEHLALRWLPPGRLQELDWAEADLPVVQQIQQGGAGFFDGNTVPF